MKSDLTESTNIHYGKRFMYRSQTNKANYFFVKDIMLSDLRVTIFFVTDEIVKI